METHPDYVPSVFSYNSNSGKQQQLVTTHSARVAIRRKRSMAQSLLSAVDDQTVRDSPPDCPVPSVEPLRVVEEYQLESGSIVGCQPDSKMSIQMRPKTTVEQLQEELDE